MQKFFETFFPIEKQVYLRLVLKFKRVRDCLRVIHKCLVVSDFKLKSVSGFTKRALRQETIDIKYVLVFCAITVR